MSAFNDRIIEEFRAGGGRVGHGFENTAMVLVHSVGAKSGTEYVNPLASFADGDDWLIVASAGGSPKHPGWFHNLLKNPYTVIEVGIETVPVTAVEVTGDEHASLYASIAARSSAFAEYQVKAGDRTIPIVRLTRR